jgi:hypothetical protein
MTDLLSTGLADGSQVDEDPVRVGSLSVGYRLTSDVLVLGRAQLIATDVAVAAGLVDIGEACPCRQNCPSA